MEDRKFDVLVTHANCSDGTACGVLAKAYNDAKGDGIKIIFAKYNDERAIIDQIPHYDDVLFADFTMSLDGMNEVEERANSVVVLDHHTTAEEVLRDKEYAIFDMDKCGARLMHDWLYGEDVEPPMLVKYVCDRDLWKFNYDNTTHFSNGFKTFKANDLLKDPEYVLSEDFLTLCITKGEYLTEAQEVKTKSIVGRTKDTDTVTFKTHNGTVRMWCINNSEFISETGNALANKHREDGLVYNASAQYFITDTEIVFSLRSIEDVDIAKIAASFGGGGHIHAAGFSIPLTTFITTDGFKKLLLDKELDYSDYIKPRNALG